MKVQRIYFNTKTLQFKLKNPPQPSVTSIVFHSVSLFFKLLSVRIANNCSCSFSYSDAPQYHSSSCPCPMQSCPKNAHTGTGPTHKANPVSANNILALADNIPKNPATAATSCKIENNLAPSLMVKPENREKGGSENATDLYTTKVLESPELTASPARGSTGLQIPPTVQHEAVQPPESNLNNCSDSLNLSQRKQPRVGKSMERERQQQQHMTMIVSDDVLQFKQEFPVKKEGDVKKEKDCEEIETFRNTSVKLERPETVKATSKEIEDSLTVNLITESGDECVDYSSKRKLDSSDDVIELSDNSTVDQPSATLKRRKLLSLPVNTPKKSPPNSYKSLIKQTSPSTYPPPSSKAKLISSTINRMGAKAILKRRNILKSKSAMKKLRLAAKAKKRAQKKKVEVESDKSNDDEIVEIKTEVSNETPEKSENSTENEHNEDKSMDGSSEYSGKSNIDLTIDRVAKGYFSESDILSCFSKHRKTKSPKKFDTKALKAGKKGKAVIEKTKKKSKVNKEADDSEVAKTNKLKKTKIIPDESKKKPKKVEVVEKDPLALDDIPSSHSTPKRKPKLVKKTKKGKEVEDVVKEVIEPLAVVESDEDDKTVETLETRDEETSTTVLSSAQTNKSTLDETDVANNNNECFEDNNRQKHQESLVLYKTPGVGWTTYNKPGKRGKKAKGRKHKLTLNDIVIPKSTSIPRWSNGWVWEGEPFQALVFLNVS